ncbi:hypothetical protein BRETT_002025 [Brettanomyces bruxellensis]|uniref:Serine/threonine-protein kinase Tel1 n=1 Tax=Dekkera bruxellensis TaxID=5007 RepID=A0A871RHG0_DEKBR|nr:uncharacterized protein BRETT_002025 [Brettanomyces bruxellensis]QOU21861.1 hypothetical protein BRETT_002025 [Brettanomyces bruxellensis]
MSTTLIFHSRVHHTNIRSQFVPDGLGSSRIRDRTNALIQLEDVNFNSAAIRSSLTRDASLNLIEALSQMLDREMAIYRRSSSNTQLEARIIKVSHLLMIVISAIAKSSRLMAMFRQKHYDMILRCLTNCLGVHEDLVNTVLSNAIINCVHSLNVLFAVQDFKDHLSVARYESVISVILDALNFLVSGDGEQLQQGNAEVILSQSTDPTDGPLFTELLTLFREFISPKSTASLALFANSNTPAAVDNYYLRITSILVNYSNRLHKTRRESRACTVIISIVNRCLLDLSTLDVKLCVRLARMASEILLNLKSVTFPHLIEQTVIFLYISADFLFLPDFPKLPGDNWNIDKRGALHQSSRLDSELQIKHTTDQTKPSSNDTSDISFDHSDIVLAPRSSLTNDTSFDPQFSSSSSDSTNSEMKQLALQIQALIMLLYDLIHSSTSAFGEDDIHTILFKHSRNSALVFDLAYLRLRNSDSQLLWLSRISMVRLLNVYFEAKLHLNSDNHPESEITNKRRHIEGTYLADRLRFLIMLSETSNSSEFMAEMIDWCSNSTHIGLLGAQLLTIGISYFATNGSINRDHADSIKTILQLRSKLRHGLMLSIKNQDKNMKYWSLLAIYSVIRLTTDFGSIDVIAAQKSIVDTINRYFELAFELFKDQKLCRPACSVICALFPLLRKLKNAPTFEFTFQKPVLQQLEAAISLSEVSGPYQICKESALFWFYSFFVCKDCRFSSIRFGNEITDGNLQSGQLFSRLLGRWMLMKNSQILNLNCTDDIELVSVLLRWAEGENVKISEFIFDHTSIFGEVSNTPNKDSSVSITCFDHGTKSLLREFVLLHRKTAIDHKFEFRSVAYLSNITPLVTETKLTNDIRDRYRRSLLSSVKSTSDFRRLIAGADHLSDKIKAMDDMTESLPLLDAEKTDTKKLLLFVNAINQLSCKHMSNLKTLFSSIDPLSIGKKLAGGCASDEHVSHSKEEEEDTQMMDEMFVQQHHEWESTVSIGSVKVYNYKNLMTCPSLEMKIVKFIFKMRIIAGYDVSAAIEKCLYVIRTEASALKSLAFYFQIELELEYLEQSQNITETVMKSLLSSLMDLLQQHQTKTYELTIWVMCRLFGRFAKDWITSSNTAFKEDCFEVWRYFSLLHDKGMLYTDMEVTEFGSCCFRIAGCMYDLEMRDEDGGPITFEKILAKGCSCFTELNNFGKVYLGQLMSALIKRCPFEERLLLYNRFIDSFRQPQKSIESSSTFDYFLSVMSTASDSLTLSAVCHLLEFSQYKQSKKYLAYSLQDVVDSNGLGSIDSFFQDFKVFIFKCWRSFELPLQDFPFETFGYTDFKTLVTFNIKELTAIALSYDDKRAVKQIAEIAGKPQKNIVEDSVSLSIPLAWTNDGCGKNIFNTIEVFMKKTHTKSAIKTQILLVILESIRLCDCSSEIVLNKAIEKKFPTECLHLGRLDVAAFKLQNSISDEAYKEMGLLIEPSKLFDLWDELTSFAGAKRFWDIPSVHFILVRILYWLEHSLLISEQKGLLRKALVVIWIFPKLCAQAFVCQRAMQTVATFFKILDLRRDTLNLALAIIHCAAKCNKNMLGDVLLPVVAELLKINEKSSDLLQFANTILQMVDEIDVDANDLVLSTAIKGIRSYLGMTIKFDFKYIINILMNNMGDCRWLLQVVSHMLPANIWQTVNPEEDRRQKFVDRLYKIQVKYGDDLTPEFKSGMGYIIGTYYSETGRVPHFESYEFDKSMFEYYSDPEFESRAKRLDILFMKMAEQSRIQADLKSTICFEQVAGQIVYRKRKSEQVEGFVNYEEVFHDIEAYIYPMSDYTSSLSGTQLGMSSSTPFKEFLEGLLPILKSLMKRVPFEKWIQRVVLALISELGGRSSIVAALESYILHIPDFSKQCFAPLVVYYVENEPAKRGRQISSMINTFFGSDTSAMSKEAVDLFLEIVLLIRMGAKRRRPKFVNTYVLLHHCEIYKAAQRAGRPKTALMLLEEYYEEDFGSVREDLGKNKKREKDLWKTAEYTFLTEVYTSLDEDDLFFGLPARPDLECGGNYVRHNGKKSGAVMLDNATFETALSGRDSGETVSRTSRKLALDMLNMGYSGVSSALYGYGGEESSYGGNGAGSIDTVYERSWKLGKWDLPTPDRPSNEHQSIYRALKALHDSNGSKMVECCWKNIQETLESHDRFVNGAQSSCAKGFSAWCRTLAVSCSMKDMMELDTPQKVACYVNKLGNADQWGLRQEAEASESLLLGRKMGYELVGKYGGGRLENEAAIGVMNEMHGYGRLMRCKGETQKSLNAAVWLNRFAERRDLCDKDARAFIERVAKFDMAAAFWKQGEETRFPVEILKRLAKEEFRVARGVRTPMLTRELLNAYIAKWSNESRQATPEDILVEVERSVEGASEKIVGDVTARNTLSRTYSMFGEFCDSELQSGELDAKIMKLKRSCRRLERDLEQVERYIEENLVGKAAEKMGVEQRKRARRNAKKEHSRLKLRSRMEMEELRDACESRRKYVERAIELYLKAVAAGGSRDVESAMDRFCGLWLENSDVAVSRASVGAVPAYEFVSWTNQLSSRLLDEKSEFQSTLSEVLVRVCLRHPFHCLYQVKSLRMRGQAGDAACESRGRAAERLWEVLGGLRGRFWVERSEGGGALGGGDVLGAVDGLCEAAVQIAGVQMKAAGKSVRLASVPGGEWWERELPRLNMPSPVSRVAVEKTGRYRAGRVAVVAAVEGKICTASSGVSRPKLVTVVLSTGERQRVLIKGGADDLRQDAIMEQVFEKVNGLLGLDNETRRRGVRVRTYRVVSLGPGSGLIEFVRNSLPLYEVLRRLHAGDPVAIDEARARMRDIQAGSPGDRLAVYRELTRGIPPAFARFFLDNFPAPDAWYHARLLYSRGVAATSIVGHILGLGDRHCNNILIDRASGEPVHIDLGVAFDQGRYLPIPENVPFRLTRDIVAGFGISGTEGLFSKSCEHVFRVLRTHSQYICGILNVLKYDPLYSWTLSPLRIHQLQHLQGDNVPLGRLLGRDTGSEASLAISVVQKKLAADGLGDEAAVRVLIRDATDPLNLATIYMGWCPFL